MLKLLISELKYSKISITIVTSFIILINIILTVENIWRETLLKTNKKTVMLWGFFALYYIIFSMYAANLNKLNKQKRLAIMKILPTSDNQIALFRILFLSFLWLIPVFIFTFFQAINAGRIFSPEWLKIIGFTGAIYFAYISIALLADDFRVLSFAKNGKIIGFFLYLLIYAIYFFANYFLVAKIKFDFANPAAVIKPTIRLYLLTARGIELNLTLAATFILFSIFTFNKRKSYL